MYWQYTQQLNVEREEVEDLLITLILEGKVEGRIDQVGMRLELDSKSVAEAVQIVLSYWLFHGLDKVLRRSDMQH